MNRKSVTITLVVCFAMLMSLAFLAVTADDETVEYLSQAQGNLRGRRLPGNELDLGDLDMAELGFAAGFVFAVVLVCCLLCMCCGGGTRCSLWDCLAIFCLWEMCCDGRNPSDFVLI